MKAGRRIYMSHNCGKFLKNRAGKLDRVSLVIRIPSSRIRPPPRRTIIKFGKVYSASLFAGDNKTAPNICEVCSYLSYKVIFPMEAKLWKFGA